MARPTEKEMVTLGPWPRGANNVAREDSVPGTAYRKGTNVDVYPGGKVRRRPGYTVVDPTPTANFWSDGTVALCTSLDGTSLYRFTPDAPLSLLYDGFVLDAEIAYASVNNLIYVSDGVTALRVDPLNDTVRPWGIPRVPLQPVLEADAGGLAPGAYQVCATYVSVDGEEGGVGVASTINLPSGGGIRATLPAFPVPAHIGWINLYVTRPGDSTFRLYRKYTAGVALDVLIGMSALGRELRTFGLEPLPAGSFAALAGGRLLVTVGNTLMWSDELNYGLYDPAHNYIPYPADIDMIAPTALGAAASGVFVAAGQRTMFAEGANIRTANNQLAYGAGANRGAPVYIDGDAFGREDFPTRPLPTWLASDGSVCVGLPDGQVISLTGGRYLMPSGIRAVLAERDLAGIRQVVVNVKEPVGSMAVSSDSADTILVRNGVVIP